MDSADRDRGLIASYTQKKTKTVMRRGGRALCHRSGSSRRLHPQGTELSQQCGHHNFYMEQSAASIRRESSHCTCRAGAPVGIFLVPSPHAQASCIAQSGKHLRKMQETWAQLLGWEDPLEKGRAPHSRILAWRISWTEELGGLQGMGSQELDMTYHYLSFLFLFPHMHKGLCVHNSQHDDTWISQDTAHLA